MDSPCKARLSPFLFLCTLLFPLISPHHFLSSAVCKSHLYFFLQFWFILFYPPFFHPLSRSRCFCFLLFLTFFHNPSHASMLCALLFSISIFLSPLFLLYFSLWYLNPSQIQISFPLPWSHIIFYRPFIYHTFAYYLFVFYTYVVHCTTHTYHHHLLKMQYIFLDSFFICLA